MVPSRFGSLLKTFRITAGLTQEDLAERARMSTRGLQDLERGLSRRPRRSTLDLLARALQLSAHDRTALWTAAYARDDPATDTTAPPLPAMFAAGDPTPLVGREREQALLHRFLEGRSAAGPSPRIALLAGEPGIGKTRLLQAAAQRAASAGWRVLAGGCTRSGGQEPYAPLLDALAQHIQTQDAGTRWTELAGCAWLGCLLPDLAADLEPLPAAAQADQERRLIHAAVGRFLANVAGPAGTLLILDDLQWAAPDALDLIHDLARAAGPLRIIGAYRDTETQAADPLGILLADLAHAGLVRHHFLAPLAPPDAATLLEKLLFGMGAGDHAQAKRALERAGGVPFFLVSYAQALSAGAAEGVPWDLAQGVRQRMALLSGVAGQVLDAAAVIGRRVPHRLLIAAVSQQEEETLAGLEAACQARLLLEDGDQAYLFAHDVIREVAEAGIGAARRELLHRRVAEALEQGAGVPAPELLAHHFIRSGDLEKGAYYLEQAADHAWDQRALSAAESHYRETLRLLDRLGRTDRDGPLCQKLGEVLLLSDRYDEAVRLCERVMGLARAAGDREGLARAAFGMAQGQALRGTPGEGIAHLELVLAELDRHETPVPASLYMGLGALLFTAGRYDESLAVSERAIDLARTSGDERTLIRAAQHRANVLQLLGHIREAREADEALLPLAEAADDTSCRLSVHRDLACILALCGAFTAALEHMDQALVLAESFGSPTNLAFTLAMRGWIAALRGDRRAAPAEVDQIHEVRREAGRSWYTTNTLIFRARLSLAVADPVSAATLLAEALVLAEESGDLQARRWAAAAMAEVDLLEHRPAVARDRLLPLLDRPGLEECDVTTFLPALAWAYLELGDLECAAQEVARALARSRPEGMRLVIVEALWVQAMIALRQEQWAEAMAALEEGIALAQAMPYPAAEARLVRLQEQVSG